MPQIANQDYNIVAPQYADTVDRDAAALSVLAGHLERGTIFDVLIENGVDNPDGIARVVSVKDTIIFIVSPVSGPINIDADYTPSQYEGLAAVQKACEMTDDLPGLSTYNGYLSQSQDEIFLCVDGKLIAAEVDGNDKLASISISNESPAADADWVNISWEDAQKLIGLPIV